MFGRLAAIFRRRRLDDEFDEELREHLRLLVEAGRARGLDDQAARQAALLKLGNPAVLREQNREARGIPLLDALRLDVRHGVRSLRTRWGFTLLATASLAIGLGANTALFSLVDALLLRSLPVAEPDRLVLIQRPLSTGKLLPIDTVSLDTIRTLRAVFAEAAIAATTPFMPVTIDDVPEPNRVLQTASVGYFVTLGNQSRIGRLRSDEAAVVISDRYWRARFDGDAGVLSRTIGINGRKIPIVGVAPAGFLGTSLDGVVDLWFLPPELRGTLTNTVIARLQPGVSTAEAEAAVSAALGYSDRDRIGVTAGDVRTQVLPGGQGTSSLRERYRAPLLALMGLVVLVLLITCANVANLLVVRNLDRAHELKVRTALGAARSQLIAQLLVESLLLACAGGVAAWFLAKWGVSLLVSTLPSMDAAARLELGADPRVITFMAITTLASMLLFALAPAWRATRIDVASALRTAPAQAAPAGARRLGFAIVGAQVALSVVLIAGAALFVQTVRNIASMPLGFDRTRLVEVEIADRVLRVNAAEAQRIHTTLLESIRAIPGVEAAALGAPFFPAWAIGTEQPAGESGFAVSLDYFTVMQIPLLRGRLLETADLTRADPVVVANQWYADGWFRGEDPIGKRGGFNDAEIVGVVGNVTADNVRWQMPVLYRLYRPTDARIAPAITVRIAPSVDPASLFRQLETAVRQVNPQLFTAVRTATQALDRSIARERMVATTSGLFGAIGLLLAGLGLFGIAASAVARRTSELGLRLALGASRWDVAREALRGTAIVFGIGLAIGLVIVAATTRMIEHSVSELLIGLRASDWFAIAMATMAMLLVAAAASVLPAWRAGRVDPVLAIRGE